MICEVNGRPQPLPFPVLTPAKFVAMTYDEALSHTGYAIVEIHNSLYECKLDHGEFINLEKGDKRIPIDFVGIYGKDYVMYHV